MSAVMKVRPGLVFEQTGKRLVVEKVEETGQCLVRPYGSRADLVAIDTAEVKKLVLKAPAVDIASVAPKEWARAVELARACALIVALDIHHDDQRFRKHASAFAIGVEQLKRYVRRYQHSPSVSTCVRLVQGRKKGIRLLSIGVEDAIAEVAYEEINLKAEATTLDAIFQKVQEACRKKNLQAPCRDTVHRRLLEAGVSLEKRRRLGPHKYQESIRYLYGSNDVRTFADQYQIDHTQVDMMVLDESRRFVLGRPWLTLVLDVATRCIVGFYVSFAPPCRESVARALVMAVSDKSGFLQALGLPALEWPMMGKPRSFLTDHDRIFTSLAIVRGCEDHMIEAELRQEKHWGGHVERALGTLMSKLHMVRGTTFSNVPKRIKYDATERAIFTGREFLRYLVALIIEHHDNRHRTLGRTPRMAWESQVERRPEIVRLPLMPKFHHDFLPRYTSVRQRDGIHWGGYRYNALLLSNIPVGNKASYRIDRLDTSKLLLELGNELHAIPRVTPVTYNEHALELQLRLVTSAKCYVQSVVDRRALATAAKAEIEATAKLATAVARRLDLAQPTPSGAANPALIPAEAISTSKSYAAEMRADLASSTRTAQRPSIYLSYSRLTK